MDPNLLDKMLTANQEFLKKLDEEADSIRKGTTSSADALKAKQEFLASERKRLEELKGSKTQAINRFDAEIQRQTTRLGALEKEIEEDKKNVAGDKKDGPGFAKPNVPVAKPRSSKRAKRTTAAKKKS